MKRIVLIGLVVALTAGVGYWILARPGREAGPQYRFVEVERGDVEAVIAATGKLEPVTTVEVGTQVSGRVAQIFVDFNDRVTRGQVVALIDKSLLEIAVRQADATVERSRATLDDAQREFERMGRLHRQEIVSEVDFNQAQYDLDVAQASMKSAQVGLEQAQRNLEYATIYAPIDGTVVERNVDVGQTVAASLSAPKLFLIAGDLKAMQILASVDEADIGQIREGQTARFVVQAYGDEPFEGRVRQVRLQSTTEENVVNYTVVVDVDNPDLRLLPGMTATVDFLVSRAEAVLKVPNAALRFRPTEAMIAELRERAAERPDTGEGTTRAPGRAGAPPGGGRRDNGTPRRATDATRLWYVDAAGKLAAARVRTGLSDGQFTEVSGEELEEGLAVIAGVTSGASAESTVNNPFQGNQPQGRRRPPGAI